MTCSGCFEDLAKAGKYKPSSRLCKRCTLSRNTARRRELRLQGHCLCGKLARVGRATCSACASRRNTQRKAAAARLKSEVLAAYGGRCECCGEHRRSLLTVDHRIPFAQGGGPREYRAGQPLYAWLRRNKYPEGFRLLCMSCNFVRTLQPCCPHETELSFSGFAAGGAFHVYIAMDAKMRRSMDRVMECCRQLNTDINEFMRPIVEEFAKRAAIEIEKKKQKDAVGGSAGVEVEKSEW